MKRIRRFIGGPDINVAEIMICSERALYAEKAEALDRTRLETDTGSASKTIPLYVPYTVCKYSRYASLAPILAEKILMTVAKITV